MTPAFKKPRIVWSTPAMTTANKNVSNAPKSCIAVSTITASPAAGPLTPSGDPLNAPTTTPPTIPAISPENNGAPEANAIPKQSGKATKNTITDADKSDLICCVMFLNFIGEINLLDDHLIIKTVETK